MTQIITHRGLDPSIGSFPFESSHEAFEAHLSRGYGIEFDPQRAADGYVVLHDTTLRRITDGRDGRVVVNVSVTELRKLNIQGSHIATLHEVLTLIKERGAPGVLSAIHLNHNFQNNLGNLDELVNQLSSCNPEHFILFDVSVTTARYLKNKNVTLQLAPSVAHSYDIERYGAHVGNTLLSINEVLADRVLFDWVWLDEWDLSDESGAEKKLYTKETFEIFRAANLKIALVTPELHATSPGLLGGEVHPDANDSDRLTKRLEEIVALKPDAVCTDYPDLVMGLIAEINS